MATSTKSAWERELDNEKLCGICGVSMLGSAFFIMVFVRALVPSVEEHPTLLPLTQTHVTSGFGIRLHPILKKRLFHEGIDFAGKEGSSVMAIGSGRIVYAGPYGGYGNLVVLLHGGEITTHYAHLSAVKVSVAQIVNKGTLLGILGGTGRTTGPHLHFELRQKGEPVNPEVAFGNSLKVAYDEHR